mgnify:CR=1 FL=1
MPDKTIIPPLDISKTPKIIYDTDDSPIFTTTGIIDDSWVSITNNK